ncbi:hypothetical protein ILYODFUR_007346, partial [Ilyodon furcidens]
MLVLASDTHQPPPALLQSSPSSAACVWADPLVHLLLFGLLRRTMCECLRGIFRVTWTPSSNAAPGGDTQKLAIKDSDIDQEDSHVYSQTRDQAVKDKRRSPPSTRSPSAPQRNPHHSGATDEQESPERV